MSNFPILYRHLSEKRLARTEQAIKTAMEAQQTGQIANPVYIATKEEINRGLDEAWSAINTVWSGYGNWEKLPREVHDFYSNFYNPQIHTILGYLKKVRTTKLSHPMIAGMLAFLEEVAPLAEMFVALKTMIVKRQPKPVEDRKAKYEAPGASKTAIGQVKALLEKITEGARDELVAFFVKRYKSYLISFLKAQKEANDKGEFLSPYDFFMGRHLRPGAKNAMAYDMVSSLTKSANMLRNDVYSANTDADATIAAKAFKVAEEIRESFVYKNLNKLDSIVEMKGNFDRGEVLGRTIDLGGLEGRLRFFFKDGSHFSVSNSVVWARSVYGKEFQRFPLLFGNVVMPDGSKMARPSEERMNEIFVGKN